MDCWHPITVRAEKPDAAQRWAHLEGKSPIMREQLAERFAPRKPTQWRRLSSTGIYVELIVVALKAWWYIHGS